VYSSKRVLTCPPEMIPDEMLEFKVIWRGKMKKRFTEEQIIRILKEAEATENTREICRQHNVTEQTFYRWRNKYGGMEVSDAKQLKELKSENSDLKKLVGELTLDNRMLKDVVSKKW
jgi:putative transposase